MLKGHGTSYSNEIKGKKEIGFAGVRSLFLSLAKKDRFSLSNAKLKWIAIISMTIDHFAASFLLLEYLPYLRVTGSAASYEAWCVIYYVCRAIGRIAAPIFFFLLVEGCHHTKNPKNYGIRLAVGALLSEIVFDRAFSGVFFDPGSQNIFFTLLLGFLMVRAMIYVEENPEKIPILKRVEGEAGVSDRTGMNIAKFVIYMAAALCAWAIRSDYSYYGITIIYLYEMLRNEGILRYVVPAVVLCYPISEIPAGLSSVFLWYYNGEKGSFPKWFFYLYYPLHLLFFAVMNAILF